MNLKERIEAFTGELATCNEGDRLPLYISLEALEIIKKQQEIIDIAKEGLEFYANQEHIFVDEIKSGNALQILNKINKMEQENDKTNA